MRDMCVFNEGHVRVRCLFVYMCVRMCERERVRMCVCVYVSVCVCVCVHAHVKCGGMHNIVAPAATKLPKLSTMYVHHIFFLDTLNQAAHPFHPKVLHTHTHTRTHTHAHTNTHTHARVKIILSLFHVELHPM